MSTTIHYPIRTGDDFRRFINQHRIDDRSLSPLLRLPEERIAKIRAGNVWTNKIPFKYHEPIDNLVRKHRALCSPNPAGATESEDSIRRLHEPRRASPHQSNLHQLRPRKCLN